jgi:hypothetical protein
VAQREETKDAGTAASGSLTQAADRIRESAKWLLVSFAAVGATLVAGLQLADIGDLTNAGAENRLTWAIVGLALGLGGVVLAIAAASSVVTKSFVTLKWLASETADSVAKQGIDDDKALLGGYTTVAELNDAYAAAMEERRDALKETYADPSNRAKLERADAADKWAIALGKIQEPVLEQASFNRVRGAYGAARWGILVGAALTAAGIAAFAWAANPPSTQTVPVVSQMPTDVVVAIDADVRGIFEQQLGAKCDLSHVRAVALAATGTAYQLASVPTEHCNAVVFKLSGSQGRVAPAPKASSETASTGGG